jgi:hypothetical protein
VAPHWRDTLRAFFSPVGQRLHVGRTVRGCVDRSGCDHQTRDALHERGIDHGAGYENTLTWTEKDKPKVTVQPVEIQLDLDTEKFSETFVGFMTEPTHGAR